MVLCTARRALHPTQTGRRDGRGSRADILEQHLPDHNENTSVVLERFANIGMNTPGVVALLGILCTFHNTLNFLDQLLD